MSSLSFFARKKEAAGDKTVQRLVTASDCDDLSLVSYNSVRDCNPSAAPKTAPTSVHHHLGLLSESTGDGLKVCPNRPTSSRFYFVWSHLLKSEWFDGFNCYCYYFVYHY